MKTLNLYYTPGEDLRSRVAETGLPPDGRLLVQAFCGEPGREFVEALQDAVRSALPEAALLGATAAAEIMNGRVGSDACVLSISSFHDTDLAVTSLESGSLDDVGLGAALACRLVDKRTRVVITFGTNRHVQGDRYLSGFRSVAPGVRVAGGMASVAEPERTPLVFTGDSILEQGVVGVALRGERLTVETHYSMHWQPLSKELVITRAEGNLVREIDGMPAVEILRKYLGASNDAELVQFGTTFPLVTERNGITLSRGIMRVGPDGGVVSNGAFLEGEKVRFSVADSAAMTFAAESLFQDLSRRPVQAVFCYSCAGRLRFARDTAQYEVELLSRLAPTAGFFCSGEFFSTADDTTFHNFTLAMLTLAEDVDTLRPMPSGSTIEAGAARGTASEEPRFRALRHLTRVTAQELEQATLALRHQAITDPLTGAYNRRKLLEEGESEVQRCRRYGRPLSVLMVDVDNFKRINDTRGHHAGDDALRALVVRLRESLRGTDLLGRLGGEEFGILLPETSLGQALRVAERLRRDVAALRVSADQGELFGFTVSLGVAQLAAEENFEAVMQRADRLLYQAKERGRNRVEPDPNSVA
jgi:diguanylate cyclase (GGDEF)-like protein